MAYKKLQHDPSFKRVHNIHKEETPGRMMVLLSYLAAIIFFALCGGALIVGFDILFLADTHGYRINANTVITFNDDGSIATRYYWEFIIGAIIGAVVAIVGLLQFVKKELFQNK